jgi:hypothetical protein
LKVNPKGVWDPPEKMNVGHARPTAAGMGGVAGWVSPAMDAAKPDQPSSFFLLFFLFFLYWPQPNPVYFFYTSFLQFFYFK